MHWNSLLAKPHVTACARIVRLLVKLSNTNKKSCAYYKKQKVLKITCS